VIPLAHTSFVWISAHGDVHLGWGGVLVLAWLCLK
jgi:hypothetical protein